MWIQIGNYIADNPENNADIDSIMDDIFVLMLGNGWAAHTIAEAMREKAEEVESKSEE